MSTSVIKLACKYLSVYTICGGNKTILKQTQTCIIDPPYGGLTSCHDTTESEHSPTHVLHCRFPLDVPVSQHVQCALPHSRLIYFILAAVLPNLKTSQLRISLELNACVGSLLSALYSQKMTAAYGARLSLPRHPRPHLPFLANQPFFFPAPFSICSFLSWSYQL